MKKKQTHTTDFIESVKYLNKSSHHGSMVSSVACCQVGRGFKSQKGRELSILNKKEFLIGL